MDYQGASSFNLGTTSAPQTYIEWVQSITWQTWLVVLLVLAILGFNIFYYLAKGTEDIHNLFAPVLSFFGKTAANTTKQIVTTAATGITSTTNAVANTIDSTLQTSPIQQNANNALQNTLNTAGITTVSENNTYTTNLPNPIQANSSLSKEGWCYIGEEQGYRSCAHVGVNDKCMSGDIFPTIDICVNPNLRQ
jgi:hypothetical protein